ncbi:MAG: hypothetical protein R3301_11590 [Saprospiraceae bacterium]|nr:hypothetical protein [Saprospiraceae bacterium]
MKHFFVVSLFLIIMPALTAQTHQDRHTEIGINVTGIITAIFASGTDLLEEDPYLLSLKTGLGKYKWRFGLGLQGRHVSEFDFFINGERATSFLHVDLRLGVERRIPVGEKWEAVAGFDLLGFYYRDRSLATSFPSRIEVNEELSGFGLGPIYGLAYHISDRVRISTESTMYFTWFTETERTTTNGQQSVSGDLNGSIWRHTLPRSLVLSINF